MSSLGRILAIVALFCASMVQAAPTGITSNLTPTDEVEQAPPVNIHLLKEKTNNLLQRRVFELFNSTRLNGNWRLDQKILNDLPNFDELLKDEELTEAERMMTHCQILDAFDRAMTKVVEDESQFNGSDENSFEKIFTDVKTELGGILQGTRELISERGYESETSKNITVRENLCSIFENSGSEMFKAFRDAHVLYMFKEYIPKFYLDLTSYANS